MAILINSYNGGWQLWEGLDSWFHSHLHETIAAQQLISIWSYIYFFVSLLFILLVYVHVCLCLFMHEFICVHMLVHLCVYMCTYEHVFVHACKSVCVQACVCMCTCHIMSLEVRNNLPLIELRSSDLMPISFTGWLHAHDCNSERA